uniref:Uncharacterized protein n=1 Tax=Polytomella parva TaxID=51329 RepID=A0A7S0UN91_9CHLO|mmetsp:Transcript_15104/g.26796  ORF Transcript_15104/g.26796 Transcript_15104/m.26796 type:complete len:579 (+) Transcript_15104:97-1833(+)
MTKKGAYVLVLDVSGQTQQSIKPFEDLIFNTLLTKFLHRPFNQEVAVVIFGCKESLHFSFPPPKHPPESIPSSSSPSFSSRNEAPSITPALYPSVSVLRELRPISPDDIIHIGSFLHRCCFGVEGVRKGEGEEKREEEREEATEGRRGEKRKRREAGGHPKENTEESSQVENEETKVVESGPSSSPPLSSPLSRRPPFPASSYPADFWNALLAAVDCVARRVLGVSDSAPLGFESGFATSAAADNEIQIVGKFDQEVNSMDPETRRALLAQIRAYRIWIRVAALVESGSVFKQPTSLILKRIQSLQSLVQEAFPFQRFLTNRVDSMASSQNMSSPVNIRRCNNVHNSNNDPNNSAKPGTANGNITITNGCVPPRLKTGSTAVRSHIQWLRTTDDLLNLNVVHAIQSQYAYRGLFVLQRSAKSREEDSDQCFWRNRTGKRIHPVQARASSESYGGGDGDGDCGVSSAVQGIAVVVYRKSRRLPFPSPDPLQPSRSLRNKGITESRDACSDDRTDQAKVHESLPYGSEVSNDEGSLHFSSNMDLDDEEIRPNTLVRCEPSLDLIGFVSWEIVNDWYALPL